jgi:hypothetical protein
MKISKEHEGSLQWLWTHQKYLEWSHSERSHLLYIQGKPGSGKSTLTKYFNNRLMLTRKEPDTQPSAPIVTSFFYSFREGELHKSHYNMLRSILYGILDQNESFFFHFQPHHRQYCKLQEDGSEDLSTWHYESLKKVLLAIGDHPRAERLYLIIDAVDESTDKDRRDMLELLFKLCTKNSCTVKVFVASRPVVELDNYSAAYSSSRGVIRMQDMNMSDIRNFVDSFLPKIDFPEYIIRQAADYIVEHAQGVFLWVRLVRDKLTRYAMKGTTKARIFDFLKSLPRELEDFYELILRDLCRSTGDDEDEDNLDEADFADSLKMFQFVLFARRSLTISELEHCLAIPDDPHIEYHPSLALFDDHKTLMGKSGMRKRITHCGRNLLEYKSGN